MANVLSQGEINQLLSAINSSAGKGEERPDKYTKEQKRAVSYIHETFANLTTRSLSAYIRSMCHVHVSSVEEFTYEEFVRSIPTPATLAVIDMNPLKGGAVLEIDPLITFSIIDRVCGGFGDGTKFKHELTDVEKAIMNKIIIHLLSNLREAWSLVLDIHPQVKAIDTNPQTVRIVSPNEIIILVTMETSIGEAEGMINICIPSSTIEPVIKKLTDWYLNKNQDNTPAVTTVAKKPAEEGEHIPKENEKTSFNFFDHINRDDKAYLLLNYFYNEHPQVIALVLAHMDPDKASVILNNVLDDIRNNVLRRIATMDKVRIEIASEIERILENKINGSSSDEENYSVVGGVNSVVKIFNQFGECTKESIIKWFEKEDPILIEEIQKRADTEST